MLDENNNTFFASSDALMNLTKPMHKNIPQHLFGVIQLVRTYLMTNFLTPLPLYFLASHSVSSSLPQKAFSLMVASNCELFYFSWSLTKLSYANAA